MRQPTIVFREKNVSRRPSRPQTRPRGRHMAGRGRTERRRPRKRYPTCLLTDPRGRFRQLAARPPALQTGSSANRRSGDSARECRVAVLPRNKRRMQCHHTILSRKAASATSVARAHAPTAVTSTVLSQFLPRVLPRPQNARL